GRADGDWHGLLGRHRALAGLVAAETGEGLDVAGTRVWAAMECLAKAGIPDGAPLVLDPGAADQWAVLISGDLRIATFATTLRGSTVPVVFAVLAQGGS